MKELREEVASQSNSCSFKYVKWSNLIFSLELGGYNGKKAEIVDKDKNCEWAPMRPGLRERGLTLVLVLPSP
jgi:hypothetical protein